MSVETDELFSLIADNAIREAEEQPVSFAEFVEGLQVIRDRFRARYMDARQELGAF
jgi:hypothetical protein